MVGERQQRVELGKIAGDRTARHRVVDHRQAFDATMQDKAFLADAAKQQLPVVPVDAKEASEIVERIYKFPPEMISKARAAAE